MNSVELVKQICKERKIPISKLERECNFSNGYINKLKEGKFPSDRLMTIANYLGVSEIYLMTGGVGISQHQMGYYPIFRTNQKTPRIQGMPNSQGFLGFFICTAVPYLARL